MPKHSTARAPFKVLSLSILSYRRHIASGAVLLRAVPCDTLGSRGAVRGGAAAFKLDTRTLTGNDNQDYRPAHVPYSDKSAYSGRLINYPVYEHAYNFRAKVQEFSSGGAEVVITSINLQRHSDLGAMGLKRGARVERKGDAESIEKACRRAKRTVRLKCKEMGADHLITFTTRAILSRDEIKAVWSKFTDNVSYALGRKFSYVCVCEPHPSNPTHLHLHAAVRGRLSARDMVIFRRCWHVSLGASCVMHGKEAPGGFNIRHIRVRGGACRRMDRIASYISKYITKDTISEFNKKRYWASKIELKEARSYWLKARTIVDALAEFQGAEFGFSPTDPKSDFFQARGLDLVWMRLCPDDMQAEIKR
jgi:hypothetical protein